MLGQGIFLLGSSQCVCTRYGVRTAVPARCQSSFVFGILFKNGSRTNEIKLPTNGPRTHFVDLLLLFVEDVAIQTGRTALHIMMAVG